MSGNSYQIETLTASDFDRWTAFCGEVFGQEPAYFRRHYLADPDRSLDSIFLIRDENQIVSTLRVFHRSAWLGGKAVTVGGIGEVCTRASHRKLGLSGRLMEAALSYIEEKGFDLSLLYSALFEHYGRYGYVPVSAHRKIVCSEGAGCGQSDLRPLGANDLEAMAALYERYSSGGNLALIRSPDYWRSWCSAEMRHPTGLFRGGRLAGYLCYEGSEVTELIGPDDTHDALLSCVPATNGRLDVPIATQTARAALKTYDHTHIMIRLMKPVPAFGETIRHSAELAGRLRAHSGITYQHHDCF